MFARFALLLAAGSAVSAPVTVRYRIEERVESKVDLSGFGQGEQLQSQHALWFATISYSDSAGGLVVHAVLDSVRVEGGMLPIPAATIDSAKGTAYHGFLDADRRLTSFTALKASMLGTQFEGTLRMLHPSVRRGAAAGAKWTDTLDTSTRTPQADLKSNVVRSFTLGGSEAWEGTPATRVDVETVTKISGSLETPGGTAEMMGGGPGTGAYYLAADGKVVGGKSSVVTDAIVTLAGAPGPIPVKTTTTTTVSVLK